MATRTAPTVGVGTQTNIGVTVHLIDASGDLTTDYVPNLATSDLLDVEAWIANYQLATQASVYGASFTQDWFGDADPDNADANFRGSVAEGINALFKNVNAGLKLTPRIYAPVPSIMQGNQDIPLLVSPLTDLVSQYLTLLGAGYALDSLQYTERRGRRNNPRIRS